MRSILIAAVIAAGIGLAGTSGTSAVPVNGSVTKDLAAISDSLMPVGWGWRRHWRWGSRSWEWGWQNPFRCRRAPCARH